MSPRTTAAAAARTRASIVASAADLGSLEGLGSLSFGRVAEHVAVTKSGVIRHFGTKEELQAATLAEAVERFRREVWLPVADEPPGIARLRAAADAWLGYLAACPFPGGCFLTAASSEFDGRPGAVRDLVVAASASWNGVLTRDAERAIADGDLPADVDGTQVAFELGGVALALNQAVQLHGRADALDRARAAAGRILRAPSHGPDAAHR